MIKKILSITIIILILQFICICNLNDSVFAGEILESGKKLYSQHNEELIIRDFFNDRKDGIFVDVGCAHYKDNSTTYYLEKHLGWSGIAVDALAEFALGYIENRPKTRFFNFIVTDHSGIIEPFYRLTNPSGLSSLDKDFLEGSIKYHKVRDEYRVIYVMTITLTELLKKNKISKIDFLSMDIEGSEPLALAGFDINKFKPELVCIEKTSKTKEKILRYFLNHGYERIDEYLKYDNVNWYFKPKR